MLAFAPIGATAIGVVPGAVAYVPGPAVTAPGAPRNVTATAGINSLTVSFMAPLSDGGAAVSEYRARLSTGEEQSAPASPIVFVGLTTAARTAQVAAVNSAGPGPYSAASNSATPTAPPVEEPEPVEDDIDAATVPAARTVVFEGSIRLVRFE